MSETVIRDDILLNWLQRNPQWQLSHDGWDTGRWQVHRVTGGRNDREWRLIGEGETPRVAIEVAILSSVTRRVKDKRDA